MFKRVFDSKTDTFPFPFPFQFSVSARALFAFAVLLVYMYFDICLSYVMTQSSVTDGDEVNGDGGTH